jgi:hypothetical protein
MLHGLQPNPQNSETVREIADAKADIAITQIDKRPALLDPTVTTPTATASDMKPARERGAAAALAEQKKDRELDRRFLTDDPCPIDFHPIAVEAMGAVGAKGKASLKTLARRAFPLRAKQDGEWDVHGQTSMYTRRLRAVVQVGLAKGNELMFAKFRQACQEMCRTEGWVSRGGNGPE